MILIIGIIGFELVRRSATFIGRLRIVLVTLVVISLVVAGAP
jgi:hypothetical protein